MFTLLATVGIPAVVAVVTAWIMQRGAARTKQIEMKTPPYDRLDSRLERMEVKNERLELRVDALEADQRSDRSWITRTIERVMSHDAAMDRLLIPWPGWYIPDPTTPPTLD